MQKSFGCSFETTNQENRLKFAEKEMQKQDFRQCDSINILCGAYFITKESFYCQIEFDIR